MTGTASVKEAVAAVLEAARRGDLEELDPRPVKGLREGAAVLGIGRGRLDRTIGALPPHLRPCNVAGDKERPLWWWPSPAACRTWWADLHAAPPPPDPTPTRPPPPLRRPAAESPRQRWDKLLKRVRR